MRMGCKSAIAGLAVSVFSMIGASAAIAQEAYIIRYPSAVSPDSVLKKYDDAFFDHEHDYFGTHSLPEQVDFVIGLTGFSDQKISWDGKRIFETYNETLGRQLASGPVIRTADLPNPFCQSLLTSGCYSGCGASICTAPSPPPAAPPVVIPPSIEAPPTPVQPQQPPPRVPALW